jgi:hypothetical protein
VPSTSDITLIKQPTQNQNLYDIDLLIVHIFEQHILYLLIGCHGVIKWWFAVSLSHAVFKVKVFLVLRSVKMDVDQSLKIK